MKTKICIFTVLLIMLVSCTNLMVKNVTALKQSKPRNHLISYFLPKREVEIKFKIEYQVTKPSSFIKDSAALSFRIKSATGKDMVREKSHKITLKEVELNPVSIADPVKLYSVNYWKSPFSKLEGNISISENGLIQTGASSTESKAYKIFQTGLESIAGIITNFVGLAKGQAPGDTTGNSDTIKKAKEILKKLEDIQNAKASIIAMSMDMDIKLFEAKFAFLKEQEELLVQQLTGEISKEEYIVCKTWDPKSEDISNGEIKKMFDIEVFLGKDGSTKLNIPILLVATVDKNIYDLINKSQSSAYDEFVKRRNRKIGFYYNIPVPVTIKIYKDKISDFTQLNFVVNSNKQASITLQMPQFGTVDFLPARLSKSEVKFYSDLGSIKEYSFTKDFTINPDEAKNITSSIDTVFSTVKYLKSLKESAIKEEQVVSNDSGLYDIKISLTPHDE
jgi:hypothetical protein